MLAQKPLQNIVTFTRSSSATRFNTSGVLETVGDNVPRLDYEPADVPVLGPELVTNGDFSPGGTGWSVTTGFTFSGGAMKINANGGAATNSGASAAVPQKKYLVSFDVTSLSSGAIKAFVGDVGGATVYGAGHYEDTIVASGTTKPQIYVMSAGTVCTVDNFSVKEITGYRARKGDPKGILIEEQRTNLLTHSNDFSATGWDDGNLAYLNVTPGAFSYAGLSFSAVALSQTWQQAYFGASTVSANAGESFTASILAAPKSVSNHYAISIRGTNYRRVDAIFNLSTGALVWSGDVAWTGLSAKSTNMGGGVWCLEITGTAPVTEPVSMLHGPCESSAQWAWKSGRAVLCDAYISSAQFEKGASRTSYIPTSGSQVTRAADNLSINTLSPWLKELQGTLYVEYSDDCLNSSTLAQLSSGDGGAAVWIVRDPTGVNCMVNSGGAYRSAPAAGVSRAVHKAAVTWDAAGNFMSCCDGQAVASNTQPNGAPPITGGLRIGCDNLVAAWANGHIRAAKYFPDTRTAAQLQTLTA